VDIGIQPSFLLAIKLHPNRSRITDKDYNL